MDRILEKVFTKAGQFAIGKTSLKDWRRDFRTFSSVGIAFALVKSHH
jgi:hypothetical protein